MDKNQNIIQRDWFLKISAGVILGFFIAIGLSGLFLLIPGLPKSAQSQLAMWLVVPVWTSVVSSCFMFRTGKRAWFGLGGLTIVAYVLLELVQKLIGIEG